MQGGGIPPALYTVSSGQTPPYNAVYRRAGVGWSPFPYTPAPPGLVPPQRFQRQPLQVVTHSFSGPPTTFPQTFSALSLARNIHGAGAVRVAGTVRTRSWSNSTLRYWGTDQHRPLTHHPLASQGRQRTQSLVAVPMADQVRSGVPQPRPLLRPIHLMPLRHVGVFLASPLVSPHTHYPQGTPRRNDAFGSLCLSHLADS